MNRAVTPRQLVLALDHAESFARDDFLAGPSNAAGLALIERWPDWPDRVMALVGPEGAGKTHLASIWAEASGARVLSASLLARGDLPAALATGALVLEDLDSSDIDEPALFHLLNLAREERSFLLITAREALTALPVTIGDLASRLRAVPAVTLDAPDDALLRAVLVKLAADRQMAVDEALVNYLATRIERSFAAAGLAIARLDEEAIRQQRPVTRALAAELFQV
ncbi:MAG TPA: chromosomal replication initiator DnaA [Pseudolabrys sp.]|nr:chromosomal replication initiator DnaA [Pseudolabrys sp.]